MPEITHKIRNHCNINRISELCTEYNKLAEHNSKLIRLYYDYDTDCLKLTKTDNQMTIILADNAKTACIMAQALVHQISLELYKPAHNTVNKPDTHIETVADISNHENLLNTLEDLTHVDPSMNDPAQTWDDVDKSLYNSNIDYLVNKVARISDPDKCIRKFVQEWIRHNYSRYSHFKLSSKYISDTMTLCISVT